jgi:CHAD domain-containing protein
VAATRLARYPMSSPTKSGRHPRGKGRLFLPPALSPSEGLGTTFASLLLYAEERAGRCREDPVRAVHEYRKSVRRARAVVRLLGPILGKKALRPLDDQLRQAVSATSDLRDTDVLLGIVRGMKPDLRKPGALNVLERELTEGQAENHTRVEEILKDGVARLRGLPEQLQELLPDDLRPRDLRDGIEATYRRTRRALHDSRRAFDEAAFHTWRKRVKELRYQLELLEVEESLSDQAELAQLAKDLGELTDLVVLRDALRKSDARPRSNQASQDQLSKRIEKQRRAVETEAAGMFLVAARKFARRAIKPWKQARAKA